MIAIKRFERVNSESNPKMYRIEAYPDRSIDDIKRDSDFLMLVEGEDRVEIEPITQWENAYLLRTYSALREPQTF